MVEDGTAAVGMGVAGMEAVGTIAAAGGALDRRSVWGSALGSSAAPLPRHRTITAITMVTPILTIMGTHTMAILMDIRTETRIAGISRTKR